MIRLSPHGTWEIVVGAIVLVAIGVGLWFVWWPLALLVVPVMIWLVAFFRDPERVVPGESHEMVSPADGLVTDVGPVEKDDHLGGVPALRIGVFLSVFNVHVNRAPCDGKVLSVTYRKGRFLNAMSHATASAENESNTIVIGDAVTGRPIAAVRQIVGLIARRIICDVRPGDTVVRGQRIGLIKFGSRTELTVPTYMTPSATVKVGDKVRGAASLMCTVAKSIRDAPVSDTADPRATPAADRPVQSDLLDVEH
jgi:phosphatidylserine decarboxylase